MKNLEKLLAEATPGPWECGKGAGWFIKREGRRAALMVGMSAEYSIISDGQVTERSSSSQECEANARLMAMSPSLAAALLVAEKALAIALDDLDEWVGCKDSLEEAGFNMDDTASRADVARAALSEIEKLTGGGE